MRFLSAPLRPIAILLTILTGFSGLVYEVTWQKYIATLLGSHSEATAAILGIFLAGLSVGYWLFGRITAHRVARARETGRPARLFALYALVEGSIGLIALAFPKLFEAVQVFSYAVPHTAAGIGFIFDVFLVVLLIGPPTILMGGTVPILTQALSRNLAESTHLHALIYGFNTAGAFAGALIGSFVLLPLLGLHDTMRWVAALNLIAAILFAVFELVPSPEEPAQESVGSPPATRDYAALALVGLLSGFALMILQNVSIRLAGLVFGSSEYTFGIVVAVFVFSLAVGSLIVSLVPRIPRSALLFNQLALLGSAFLLYMVVPYLPAWAFYLRSQFGLGAEDFLPFQVAYFFGAGLLLGPSALFSGATLPLLFHSLRGRYGDLGSVAGVLYSWNTIGSFLGAMLGGYVLLIFLDLHHVFRVALIALVLSAGLLLHHNHGMGRQGVRPTMAAVAVAVITIILLPAWDYRVLTMGLFRLRNFEFESIAEVRELVEARLRQKDDRIIFFDDDPIASISVREHMIDGRLARGLITNGKGDGNTIGDYPTMALASLISTILADDAKRAFVVGYGTGVSVGELSALEGMEEVIVAEISPAVLEAAPLFDFANGGVSKKENVHLLRSDAYRAFVRSDGRFDVIISVPSNPWTAGIEMLYSAEFLSSARERLTSGGVYAQWYHQYETDEESVALVLRTFASVFDRVAVWYGLGADFLILGMQDSEMVPDLEEMQRRTERPDIRAGLARAGIDSFPAFLAHELVPVGVLSASDLSGPVHTLFRPRLNHLAARAFFRGDSGGLPLLGSAAAARIGIENSSLGRYLAALPEAEASKAMLDATREACRNRRRQCVAFAAAVIRSGPEPAILTALLEEIYSGNADHRVGGAITPRMMASIVEVAGGIGERAKVVPLVAADRATRLYRRAFQYALPFDPAALIETWRRCRAPANQRGLCQSGLEEAISLDWRQ